MSFPAPPWVLYGWVGLLVDWLALDRAKEALLPEGFRKKGGPMNGTLGGHYVAAYTPRADSSLDFPFHEFGFLSSQCVYGNEKGLHLSRMAVDHPTALEGGRDVWGINKFTAAFEQAGPFGLKASSPENRLDVSVTFHKRLPLGWWKITFPFLNRCQGAPIRFAVTLKGFAFLCTVSRKGFHHNGRLIPLLFPNCRILIHPPESIPEPPPGW